MSKIKELKVRPVNYPLRGDSTIWESYLMQKGWNNLPEDQRYGLVTDFWQIRGKPEFKLVSVYFPAVDITLDDIFIDEVVKYK